MNILVVNAGSSSLKYQLIDMNGEVELAKGLVERIGIEGSRMKHTANGETTVIEKPIANHEEAAQMMLNALQANVVEADGTGTEADDKGCASVISGAAVLFAAMAAAVALKKTH